MDRDRFKQPQTTTDPQMRPVVQADPMVQPFTVPATPEPPRPAATVLKPVYQHDAALTPPPAANDAPVGAEPIKPIYEQSLPMAVEAPQAPVVQPAPAPEPAQETPLPPVVVPERQAATTLPPQEQEKPRGLSSRHKVLVAASATALVLVAAGAGGMYMFFHHTPVAYGNIDASKSAAASIKIVKVGPSFKPLAPATKPDLATSGSYDSTHGTYGFVDTLDDQSVAITEQALPNDAAAAQNLTGDITKNLAGNKVPVETTRGNAALLTDSKSGFQSMIFGYKGVLVLIQSNSLHDTDKWVAYVNSLQ